MALTKVSFSMIQGALINVLDYGADPTGVADSTAAINAASDAAHALTAGTVVDPYNPKTLGGCVVFFPAGEYTVSGKLTIYENCGFRGAGNRSSVIYSSYNGNIIENQPSATYDAFGMLIEDIGIIGDRTKTSQVGIALLRAWEMSMKNVLVMNCGSHGILMRQCILNTLVAVTSQRNVGAGIRITGGTVSWSDATATNLPSNANDVFNGHFAFNDGAGIVLDNTGTGGVNQCTFYGGGCEYNYRSSAAGVGANIEVSASGYLSNTFNDMSVEDTEVLYHVYVIQTSAAPTRFNNLMHIANGPSTYPLRAVKVVSGTAYISLAQQNGNAYPTTNGSTAPFELTKATGLIYTLNCAGVVTNGLFVCDETGATTGLYNNTRMSNYGYLYGVFNHFNDNGQAGPSFYQSGQSFPYIDFSTFNKGILLGTGAAAPTSLFTTGAGSPEGVITAAVGSIYTRTDGSTSTTLYVKTSGTGNTGWTAK
jgi:hypothetical protein